MKKYFMFCITCFALIISSEMFCSYIIYNNTKHVIGVVLKNNSQTSMIATAKIVPGESFTIPLDCLLPEDFRPMPLQKYKFWMDESGNVHETSKEKPPLHLSSMSEEFGLRLEIYYLSRLNGNKFAKYLIERAFLDRRKLRNDSLHFCIFYNRSGCLVCKFLQEARIKAKRRINKRKYDDVSNNIIENFTEHSLLVGIGNDLETDVLYPFQGISFSEILNLKLLKPGHSLKVDSSNNSHMPLKVFYLALVSGEHDLMFHEIMSEKVYFSSCEENRKFVYKITYDENGYLKLRIFSLQKID